MRAAEGDPFEDPMYEETEDECESEWSDSEGEAEFGHLTTRWLMRTRYIREVALDAAATSEFARQLTKATSGRCYRCRLRGHYAAQCDLNESRDSIHRELEVTDEVPEVRVSTSDRSQTAAKENSLALAFLLH